MKAHSFAAGLMICCAFIAAGCSATFEFNPKQSLGKNLGSYNRIALNVQSTVAGDMGEELSALREMTIAELRSLHAFTTVTGNDEEIIAGTDDVLVAISVTEFHPVTGMDRFLQGVFAGKASITVNVEFIDLVSRSVLGVYEAKGSSGGIGFSGGTDDAIEQTVAAVVEIIKSNL